MVVPSTLVDSAIFREDAEKTPCYPCMAYMPYVCAPFSTRQISRHNVCSLYVTGAQLRHNDFLDFH